MDEDMLNRYFEEVDQIRGLYSDDIQIFTGLEIDYIEGAEDMLIPIINQYQLDFILGSIHCLPAIGWHHLINYRIKDTWPVFKEYFNAASLLIRSGIFDSFAHIDFIWRYIKWPEKETENIIECIKETIALAASHSMAIEINSNAYIWSQINDIKNDLSNNELFNIVIKAIKESKTSITVGSDAHRPEFLGNSFPQIAELLTNTGISEYTIFQKRHPIKQLITQQ